MIPARDMELRSGLALAIAALTLVGAAVVPIRAEAQPPAPAAESAPALSEAARR